MTNRSIPRRHHGFLIIAAVFLIVVLAALVGYLMTVSTTSQAASAADLNSARAFQAARAGTEWGIYQILRNTAGGFKTGCDTATVASPKKQSITFSSTLSPFTATVRCYSSTTTEGAGSVTTYSITSNACNVPTSSDCPNTGSPPTATYVEREVNLAVTR